MAYRTTENDGMDHPAETLPPGITHLKDLSAHSSQLQLHFPGTEEYRKSAWTGNRLYWGLKPAFVIRATEPEHCAAALILAQRMKTSLTVKGGGHSFGGWSNNDGGILLDMAGLRNASLQWVEPEDPEPTNPPQRFYSGVPQCTSIEDRRGHEAIMTVEGGALWGDVYKLIGDNQLDSRIIVGGRCPGVGVAGFLMGGGLSPFTRSYGLGCDMLEEITLYMPVPYEDGDKKRHPITKKTVHPGHSIFNALCGGGGGNFGIVTEMKFRVPEEKGKGGRVTTGRFTVSVKDGNVAKLPRGLRDLVEPFYKITSADLSEELTAEWEKLTIDTTWLANSNKTKPDQIRFTVYYNGRLKQFHNALELLFPGTDANTTTLVEYLRRNTYEEPPSTLWQESLEDHWAEEQSKWFMNNKTYHIHSSYLFANHAPAVDAKTTKTTLNRVAKTITELQTQFKALDKVQDTDTLFQFTLIHGGGAATRNDPDRDMAFPWRAAEFFGYVLLEWADKAIHIEYRDELHVPATPHETKTLRYFLEHTCDGRILEHAIANPDPAAKKAAFINFTERGLGRGFGSCYYGKEGYERLRRIKRECDPENVLAFGLGIEPAPRPPPPANGGSAAAGMRGGAPAGVEGESEGSRAEMEELTAEFSDFELEDGEDSDVAPGPQEANIRGGQRREERNTSHRKKRDGITGAVAVERPRWVPVGPAVRLRAPYRPRY